MKSTKLNRSVVQLESEDRIVEGLRIPPSLDNTIAVNFVLTQEPGKLKPKDLKAAIEKNRAQREARTEEQRTLREQGGGAGVLDLKGILAEERLNASSADSDPFRRQLREMAFLADVEEVEKQESEKEFRVSEDFLGAELLSEREIERVKRERENARLRAMHTRWGNAHARQRSTTYAPTHTQCKAGPPMSTALALYRTLSPSFDVNRNDVWSKRMNTLRRFVALVSTWIVRKRVSERMQRVRARFVENNAHTREEVRAFVERENEENKVSPANNNNNNNNNSTAVTFAKERQLSEEESERNAAKKTSKDAAAASLSPSLSLADILLSEKHTALIQRERNEEIMRQAALRVKKGLPEFTPEMCRRNLFPVFDRNSIKFDERNSSTGSALIEEFINNRPSFDDRSFYHLKTKPHFITRAHSEFAVPAVPLHFGALRESVCERRGAYEELCAREPVDSDLSLLQLESVTEKERERERETESETAALTHTAVPVPISECVRESERDMRARERERLFALGIEEDLLGLHGERAPMLEPDFISMLCARDERELLTQAHTQTESERDTQQNERESETDRYTPFWLHTKDQKSSISLREVSSLSSLRELSALYERESAARERERDEQRVAWRARDMDSLTTLPTFRDFTPSLRVCESDAVCVSGRASASERDEFLADDSLRNRWLRQQASVEAFTQPSTQAHTHLGGNFSSVNTYLLGDCESRWRDGTVPQLGPTLLSERYRPDRDRHASGLSCFAQDHLRSASEWDPDLCVLQRAPAAEDYLTESESDNEEEESRGVQEREEERERVWRERLRAMLQPDANLALSLPVFSATTASPRDAKGAKGKEKEKEKDKKAPPVASAASSSALNKEKDKSKANVQVPEEKGGDEEDADYAFTDREKKKEHQVELLRDRRTLELESHWTRTRQKEQDAATQRWKEISLRGRCVLTSLPVQLPFHQYEQQVYQLFLNNESERETMKEMLNHFVEIDPRTSISALPSATSPLRMSSTAPPSPGKK